MCYVSLQEQSMRQHAQNFKLHRNDLQQSGKVNESIMDFSRNSFNDTHRGEKETKTIYAHAKNESMRELFIFLRMSSIHVVIAHFKT